MTHQEEISDATHRSLACSLFNHTWTLLDKKNRTPEDDIAMVHCAHASRYHWSIVGTPLNFARGEWQIARVYATLEHWTEALRHATLYFDACVHHDFGPFDLAFAHEGLARTLATTNPDEALKHITQAKTVGERIEKDEDREWLHQNLNDINASLDG